MKREIKEIEIENVDLDTSQPRQVIEEDKIKDLAEDMKEAGQLVPVILTPCYKKGEDTLVIGQSALKHKDWRWFVLDGYRRILGAKINKWKTIDAELKYELGILECLEIQFRANAKRVQITVKEMAKAVERFAQIWKKEGKKGDVVQRLSKITGFSTSYFQMAQAIVDEEKNIKDLIYSDKVGAYYSAEKKNSSKDKEIRAGMDEAVKEYIQKTGKKVGALTPRILKPEFVKISKNVKEPKERKVIAKAKTLEYLNRSIEQSDKESNFPKYIYDAREFYERILRWNIKNLSIKQVELLSEEIMKSVYYLKEEKRKLNKFKHSKRKGRNM